MAKLLIIVLYLSTALLAIILLAASTGEAAKAKVEICPAIRVGTVKYPQACTNMCKKKFGSLYYDSLCKTIKKKKPSSLLYGVVEESIWSKLFSCGCKSKKKDKKTKCPEQPPPTPPSSDGGDAGDQDLNGATPCSRQP